MSFVRCPEKITSPAPDPGARALGLAPNMPCGEKVTVLHLAPAMEFRCARGHRFYATPDDVFYDSEEEMLENKHG